MNEVKNALLQLGCRGRATAQFMRWYLGINIRI